MPGGGEDGPLLRAVGVAKRLGERLVLRDVTLAVPAGAVVVVLGPNGSGKSTLLKLAAGVWAPSRGRLERFGRPVSTEATDSRVGYLGHRSFLYGALSGLDNLTFYARLYGVPRPRERAAELLGQVGLGRFQHEPVRRYSRGMEQRAAMARAFVAHPQLLLLDEPYTGMDVGAAGLLDQWIRRTTAEGGGVLLITHHLDEAARMADQVGILWRGHLAAPLIEREGGDGFRDRLASTYEARFPGRRPRGA